MHGLNRFYKLSACILLIWRATIRAMNTTESALRAIKDRIAMMMGELDEASSNAATKENHRRLINAARELHRCADDMQNILMRIQPR